MVRYSPVVPPTILWASPLPPTRSGVSDHAVELLPFLARRTRVRVLAPPDWDPTDPPLLPSEIAIVPQDSPSFDHEVALVHLGNNPYHRWLLPELGRPRTAVVLHDAVLHHLLVESTLAEGKAERYGHQVAEAHGEAGRRLARAREIGYTGRLDPFLFPARRPFLVGADAVVVHSRWVREEVEKEGLNLPILEIGLAVADPGEPRPVMELRRRMRLPAHALVLMHLGFLTAEKGVATILAALAAARATGIPAHLAVVGEGGFESRLQHASRELGLDEHVTFVGWVDAATLREAPAAADLGVVLREPSAGETSAAAVRFLACGTPVAVSGRRQFLEWDEAAAPRLTPGPSAAADLARLLGEAAEAPRPAWQERRAAARAAYLSRHLPEQVAGQLVDGLAAIFG